MATESVKSHHNLTTTGPHRYPGGKNGWYTTYCSCLPEKQWWGATTRSSEKPALAHKKAKDESDERHD